MVWNTLVAIALGAKAVFLENLSEKDVMDREGLVIGSR